MGGRRGTLALVAADGAVPVPPVAVLLEEMLAGWRRQQQARRLTARLIGERERVVRQFAACTGCWPCDLPRAFRTADLWLIHAAACCSRARCSSTATCPAGWSRSWR